MRTLVISILIFLTASVSLIPASGQSAEENPSEQQQQENPAESQEYEETASAIDANEPNAVSTETAETITTSPTDDPNVIRERLEQFEDLSFELSQVNDQSRDEIRGWTRRTDERLDLVLAVQQQIKTELNFIRQLAAEEGAVKTTIAIDKILLDRQERFKDVIERLEREQERLRREEEREREREERSRDRSSRRR